MAEYKSNSEKNKMQPYDLPTTPGATLHLPSRLGYGARIRVRQSAYKVHVEQDNEGTDRVFQTVDPAAAEQELLIAALLDSRTYHNLTKGGKPIQIDRVWIENEMDEDDALYLGARLMNDMNEEIGLPDEEEEPPVGNQETVKDGGTPSPENGSPSPASSQKGNKKNPKEKESSGLSLVANE